jgi:hypothetical protein
VEWALHSKFLGTRGVGLQREGGYVHGSHNKTRSYAIPGEKSLEEGQGSQHEGGFEDLHSQ